MGKLINILKLLPALLAVILSLELAIKGEGKGSARLELLIGLTRDIFDATPELQQEMKWEPLVQVVTKIVSRIVATFNLVGVFQKSASTAVG